MLFFLLRELCRIYQVYLMVHFVHIIVDNQQAWIVLYRYENDHDKRLKKRFGRKIFFLDEKETFRTIGFFFAIICWKHTWFTICLKSNMQSLGKSFN